MAGNTLVLNLVPEKLYALQDESVTPPEKRFL